MSKHAKGILRPAGLVLLFAALAFGTVETAHANAFFDWVSDKVSKYWKPSTKAQWVREHTTKTTLSKFDDELYVELYCRIEPGRIVPITSAILSSTIQIPASLAKTALGTFGQKGDVFCVALKTKNLKHPRAANLADGPDLAMSLKAYVGDDVHTKSDTCEGSFCLVGKKLNLPDDKDTDAMTICVELPDGGDGKPRSLVVGAGEGKYEKLIDQDGEDGKWPVLDKGCEDRTF